MEAHLLEAHLLPIYIDIEADTWVQSLVKKGQNGRLIHEENLSFSDMLEAHIPSIQSCTCSSIYRILT